MRTHTNYQIIHDQRGLPAFVVIPYNEYQAQLKQRPISLEDGVPSEVVDLFFDKQYSALKAWREYLGLTQAEVANRLGISQSAYSQHENAKSLRKATREKIAIALGIKAELLDF
ncbi:transcriptional regulator [Pasteurellaceae bacterium 15-036681]|nr:transcriptional regulator [Pasteurellaceae bacterium 15-036681]